MNYRDYYNITPLIVRADSRETITISPRFPHADLRRLKFVRVEYIRVDGVFEDGKTINGWNGYQTIDHTLAEDGTLQFTLLFRGEIEHSFRIIGKNYEGEDIPIFTFAIYSLKEDLFNLRPYKGDFHLHTINSDGAQTPEYMAASSRKIGMDFIAITDHRKYEPSLTAVAFQQRLSTSFRCYPGEEVHAPDNAVHIVNFGGSFSVNKIFQEDEARYRREVAEYAENVPETALPESRFQVAASEWVFDLIRKGGGIALYCHPYWKPHNRYYILDEVNEVLLKRRNFDAIEVFGGYDLHELESNQLEVVRYYQSQVEGVAAPAVGVSDSHSADNGSLFGWFYTIVFADQFDFSSIAQAIRANRCVAVEAVKGEFPRIVGDFRLVKYAYFLLREFYPIHDRLCAKEGELMLEVVEKDSSAAERLAMISHRIGDFVTSAWAK